MLIASIVLIVVSMFFMFEYIDYKIKEKRKKAQVIQKGSFFRSAYNIHKHVNRVRNISLFEFDKVLNYIESIPDIKLHISTVNGRMVDFILEMDEPVMRIKLRKGGLPCTTFALDSIKLTEYYLRCINDREFQEDVMVSMFSSMSNTFDTVVNKRAARFFLRLSKEHAKELKEQMVDEHDFRYWLKSSFMC